MIKAFFQELYRLLWGGFPIPVPCPHCSNPDGDCFDDCAWPGKGNPPCLFSEVRQ